MITPELKDSVLNAICNCGLQYEVMYRIPKKEFFSATELSIDNNDFVSIMSQFQRKGFIEHYANTYSVIPILLKIEATDFLQRGGFVAQEKCLPTIL
ncbi:MAG: hypothetical protein LBU90_10370 [Bacteroidales bacterium]|jgi:hypothetical protein|nr:hypothetical protein [Bacteroidales bacterium]